MSSRLLPQNEHPVDRVLRIVVGLGILSLVFIGPQTPWAWFGLIPLVTGLVGSCPIYTLFGLSTCRLRLPMGSEPPKPAPR